MNRLCSLLLVVANAFVSYGHGQCLGRVGQHHECYSFLLNEGSKPPYVQRFLFWSGCHYYL